MTQIAGNLGFADHTNRDTFTMEDFRSEYSFDSVADGMSEIQQTTKTCFLFVDGDNMGLGFDGSDNGFQEVFLVGY